MNHLPLLGRKDGKMPRAIKGSGRREPPPPGARGPKRGPCREREAPADPLARIASRQGGVIHAERHHLFRPDKVFAQIKAAKTGI